MKQLLNRYKDIYILLSTMYFVYDLETSGLPLFCNDDSAKKNRDRYYDPRDLDKYDTARVVQISWIILDNKLEQVEKASYLIKPDGFIIPDVVIKIHRISNERAHAQGIPIQELFHIIRSKLNNIKTLVAHNVMFDYNVFRSECYRYGETDIVSVFEKASRWCTMTQGKELLQLPRNPKLSLLYQELYGEEMVNAHDAEYDTFYCCQCFKMLKQIPGRDPELKYRRYKRKADNNEASTSQVRTCNFTMGEKDIILTEEQSKVVFEDPEKRGMLVISSAGSGKTTTIVCRIQYLVNSGIPEDSIILTTFTRDAANDMEAKLEKVFGYKPNVIVGTIDSLALRYISQYKPDILTENTNNVGEYAVKFLELLKNKTVNTNGIQHLIIDEFQDINELQYKIFREYFKKGVKITAVGDDAQNIYSFRGSTIKYILDFPSYFEDSVVHKLTTNFRSTQDIVSFANASIEKNEFQIPKTMVSYDPKYTGIQPQVHYFQNAAVQYEFVKDKILEYRKHGYKLSQMAVLCPQNSYLYQLEEVLTQENVPNVLLEGKTDVRTRIRTDHVCLCTIHKSKGLEWDIVFIIQMNDEIFPSKKDYTDVSESRRLFYVAVTRAKNLLHITYAPIFNSKYVCRFVSEVHPKYYFSHNITPECIGYSTANYEDKTTWLSKFVERLNGHDYTYMKNTGLFPESFGSQQTFRLYPPFEYKPFIKENEIYADYGIFLNVLMSRIIGETWPQSNGFQLEAAVLAVHSIRMDYQEFKVYQKHKNSFVHNLESIAPYMENMYKNMRLILSLFLSTKYCQDIEHIESADINVIMSILRKLYEKSVETGIAFHHIPIFTERFLPSTFQETISRSYETFTDREKSWKAILWDIWEVSKCTQIVRDRRRRLLYKHIEPKHIYSYNTLYNYMCNTIIPFIGDMGTPSCHGKYVCENGMQECIPLRVDDVIIDYTCSNDDKVKADTLVRLLCCKAMVEESTDHRIRRVGVLNLLRGHISMYDVSSFNQGNALLRYVKTRH
jgi:DNA polymerase III epsilon subunit-like protein